MFTILLMLPFIEAWITGDKREHHLLQRPRNAPTRTATMVALMTFYGVLWEAGGNDIIAIKLHMSINNITYANRVLVFVAPVIAFIIARRWCIALQRADQARLLHGYESGVIMRSPEGAYAEKHLPISEDEAYTLTARDRDEILPMPTEADENGVANRKVRLMRLRARASQALVRQEHPEADPRGASGGSRARRARARRPRGRSPAPRERRVRRRLRARRQARRRPPVRRSPRHRRRRAPQALTAGITRNDAPTRWLAAGTIPNPDAPRRWLAAGTTRNPDASRRWLRSLVSLRARRLDHRQGHPRIVLSVGRARFLRERSRP